MAKQGGVVNTVLNHKYGGWDTLTKEVRKLKVGLNAIFKGVWPNIFRILVYNLWSNHTW